MFSMSHKIPSYRHFEDIRLTNKMATRMKMAILSAKIGTNLEYQKHLKLMEQRYINLSPRVLSRVNNHSLAVQRPSYACHGKKVGKGCMCLISPLFKSKCQSSKGYR